MNKVKNIGNILKNTIFHAPLVFAGMVFAIVGTIVTGVLPPLVLEKVVNTLTAGDTLKLTMVLIYFGTLAVSGLLEASKEVLITVFGQKVTHETRSVLAAKLNALPAAYFTSHESGDTASCIVNDVNTLETLFTSGIISMVTDAFKILSILFVIFLKSTGLAVLIVLVTPVLFRMTMVFQKRMLSAQKENRKAVAQANQQIPETIRNIRTIRVLKAIRFMEKRYDRAIERSFQAQEKSNFYDAVYSPIIIFVSSVIIAVMMSASVKSGVMLNLFGMSVGTAVAVISYVGKIFDPLESIGMEITNIQSALAGLSRINAFLREEEMVPVTEKDTGTGDQDKVVLKDLAFSYEDDRLLFEHFDLTVEEGETVTVAGRTGAGKSTLFKLLLGLYSPKAGTIRLFGRDPLTVRPEEKRHFYGYVEQQFKAVPGTVLDQVTLADPDVTEDRAQEALKTVGLYDTVMRLPDKGKTEFAPSLFSQGQLQLLSIARAIVCDPRLLLLDEITANLDSGTEAEVLEALKKASGNRAVLSVSHRLYEASGGRIVTIA